MKKNIYILGGLGADERVYRRLDLSDFSTTYIRWEIPKKKESIENYSSRLLNQIKTSLPTLIGISFGGLIAIEIAKQINAENVILIASAKTKNEIPYYYRWAGNMGLHKMLPLSLIRKISGSSDIGLRSYSNEEKQLMKAMFSDTDPKFLRWAIDKIVNWRNNTKLENIRHIHGTKDRIFPFRLISCDFEIINAGHQLY